MSFREPPRSQRKLRWGSHCYQWSESGDNVSTDIAHETLSRECWVCISPFTSTSVEAVPSPFLLTNPESAMPLDLDAYCQRVGYTGERTPTLATLRALQQCHLQHITFENLNPLLGKPVPLDLASLERKLVQQRRGGYCFENNLFFMAVLTELGFTVRGITARVYWNQPEDAQPPRSHMLLLVTIDDEDYLSDVGFGGLTPTAPLKLHSRQAQSTPLETCRVLPENNHYRIEVQLGSRWRLLYRFDLMTQWPIDFDMANWYVSCHPASKFVNNLIAVRTDMDRRHTLLNGLYTIRYPDGRSDKQNITYPQAMTRLLADTFQINLQGLEQDLQAALTDKALL